MAIISMVGENLRSDPALFGRAVMALDRVALRLVSQAAGRRNVTFVLRDADVPGERPRRSFVDVGRIPFRARRQMPANAGVFMIKSYQ